MAMRSLMSLMKLIDHGVVGPEPDWRGQSREWGGDGLESTIKESLSGSFDTQETKANGVVAGRGTVSPQRQWTLHTQPGSVLVRPPSDHASFGFQAPHPTGTLRNWREFSKPSSLHRVSFPQRYRMGEKQEGSKDGRVSHFCFRASKSPGP